MPVETDIPSEVTAFLDEGRDRYDFGRTADADDRAAAEDDNRFANADNKDLGQWDDAAKKARKKRPVLQWNRIPVYVQQVVNDGRQNKPSIKISPGDGGIAETAEYFQSRIRHIEYECNVDTAKDTARDQQVTSGRGFVRVSTEWVPGQMRQRICIDRIENQFSVVFDPAAVKYDRSDADWAFIISQISKDAHKRKYGKESLVNRLDFADAIKLAPDWIGVGENGEMVQIAEYFVKEYHDEEVLEINGLPVWRKDLTKEQYASMERFITARRKDQCATVWQYVINGAEVLSKTEWIGSTIPIVPFWGREAVVDGKRRTFSLVRNARDPQKLLNLYVSNIAEIIGQMPKSPYMVPIGGIPAASERDWENVNNTPRAWMYYEAYDTSQRPIPAPTRILAEPPIQALSIGVNQSIDAIKAAMGIYDAALGARSNENSGLAIERRKKQSSITNYHFPDNEARSNKYLGEILIELIPLIDQPGTVNPIRTEDGDTHLVPIGQEHQDWKTGQKVCHDLKSGQYGVTVSQGPSYDSARQEQYERDATLIQAQPELIFSIGPQMFRSDDTPGSDERADALERYINMKLPGMFPPKDQQEIPPQVQQQIAGMQQELQKAQGIAVNLHEQIQTDAVKRQTDVEIKKMDIDWQREKLDIESRTKIDVAALTHGIMADIAQLKEHLALLDSELQRNHEMAMGQQSQQHQAEQADKAQAAASESQAVDQQHQSAMAEQAAESAGGEQE